MRATNYIHNVKLNWAINERATCNIPEFFSWNETDVLEAVRDLYIVKVSESFFDFATNGLKELPVSFWRHVKGKSIHSKSFSDVNYTCVITDGFRVMALDTWAGYFHAMKKSRISVWDEFDVIEKSKYMDIVEFSTEGKEYVLDDQPSELFNRHMIGLTRTEIECKESMLEYVEYLVCDRDASALRYYLKEFDNVKFKGIKTDDVKILHALLLQCVLDGWTEGHVRLLEVLKVSLDILDTD